MLQLPDFQLIDFSNFPTREMFAGILFKHLKHRKQLEVLEIQHQSEMELLADIVTFIKDIFNQSELSEFWILANQNDSPGHVVENWKSLK